MGGFQRGPQSITGGPPNAAQGVVKAPGEWAVARLPVWLKRPADGIPFDKFGAILLPAVSGAFTTIFSFTVPQGYNAILTHIANATDDPAYNNGDGSILWAIAKNLVPGGTLYFPDYAKINVELGTTQIPSPIEELSATELDIIALQVMNVSNTTSPALPVVGRIVGYFYPKEARPPNTGLG
jgi:hypothetical protein